MKINNISKIKMIINNLGWISYLKINKTIFLNNNFMNKIINHNTNNNIKNLQIKPKNFKLREINILNSSLIKNYKLN